MKPAILRVVGGGECGEEIDLDLPTTIGRGRDNDITLTHSLVSRQHCRICRSGDLLVVRDLNSLNGTYIGSQKVQGESFLRPGELLTVGTVTFRAVYGDLQAEEADNALAPDRESASVVDQETADLSAGGTMLESPSGEMPARPEKGLDQSAVAEVSAD